VSCQLLDQRCAAAIPPFAAFARTNHTKRSLDEAAPDCREENKPPGRHRLKSGSTAGIRLVAIHDNLDGMARQFLCHPKRRISIEKKRLRPFSPGKPN
jgi:hypothetical protein